MAIKTLTTLVKLHKRRVDVLRREMVALEEERRQLQTLTEKLKQEHAEEMRLASTEPKYAGFFGASSAHIKERIAGISQEIKRLDTAIEAKIEAIREEFSEEKKYDIARGHARKRLEEQAQHRQQQRFDEIAAQQHRAHGMEGE